MALENGVEISRTQLRKRIKEALKRDAVMTGDGHLNLHSDQPRPLPAETVTAVQERILVALSAAQITDFDEAELNKIVSIILYYIGRPGRGKTKKPKPQPKPKKHKNKAKAPPPHRQPVMPRPQQRPAPVIQVTIKKARNFHYPLDLKSGDL